jgi:hypothetical protein
LTAAVRSDDSEGYQQQGTGSKTAQARIDRSIFVSSAQFDTEFDAMKTMYALASKVGILISVIRPVFETRPGNQTEDQRVADIQTKYNLASLAFNEFASQIDSLSPFYPVELHTAFVECRSAASTELGQLSAEGLQAFSPVGYRDAMENERAFRSAHQLASTIIRNRLDQLSVVA